MSTISLDTTRISPSPADPSKDASIIADALWGIAAAITEGKPKPTGPSTAFLPALELLPIGSVAELDIPTVLDGPEAESWGIATSPKIVRVTKHSHPPSPTDSSAFLFYESDSGAPWYGDARLVLEMGLTARDFADPKGELEVDEVEDMINEPDHYKLDGRECIEFVRALPFVWGNVVKYVWRFRRKNGLEDLRKARRYLEIAREESIRRPESMENYEFFLKLFYEHDSADEVGEQRLYVLRQIFVPLEYEHEVETVEQELDRLIDLMEREA